MTLRSLLTILVCLVCSTESWGEEVRISIRAVFHNPSRPVGHIFVSDQTDGRVKLNMVTGGLSKSTKTKSIDGKLYFFSNDIVDPEDPLAGRVATLRVPDNLKSAIVILVPAPPKSKSPLQAILIPDSSKEFSKGESRVLSLIPVEAGVEAGEHKVRLLPGKVSRIPAVEKLDDYNMAQTNFYYKLEDSWVTFTERRLQFLDDYRRIFIISPTAGGTQPMITTIIDTATEAS
ncbi:hypothetical protein ACFQY0_08450 [Haloferula chungangensis]|uniref:Uncharacterized protein n=1 Tax=Haloferula chungangensis TaxID=1048331 RepID=A0ABW2L6N1_9BACT